MIVAQHIQKAYGNLHVLKGIELTIQKGEVVAITGASGAGKTTLLQILGTLDKADSGQLWIDNTELSALKTGQLAEFRNRKLGFVFQFHHLLPEFTALENVCMPGWIGRRNESELKQAAMQLLDFLHLTDRAHHKPSALSGGEQQRVAVARALINNPAVVFADEPSGNLDSTNAAELHDLFFKLRKEFGQTFVIVTHNESLAALSDRKLVMKDGIISG